LHRIPGVLEVNSPLIEEQARYRRLANRELAESIAERAFDAASSVVAVSQEVADYVNAYLKPARQSHIVPNGVAPDRSNTGRLESDVFTIGFVGTLKPWHGVADLLDAFAQVHKSDCQTRLLIIGDGPEREPLAADVVRCGLCEAVSFTGAVPPMEIPLQLAKMDVAVAPYPTIDRFYFSPLKLYEYLAAGLPTVASRSGQIAAVIDDGVTGLLYPPGDTAALAAALQRLRSDPPLCTRLGRAGRELVLQRHTWKHTVERMLELARLTVSSHQFFARG
jgi:glycosyltransferase involved in cell wall biosynthesis